jgi:hypothetical protein
VHPWSNALANTYRPLKQAFYAVTTLNRPMLRRNTAAAACLSKSFSLASIRAMPES